MLVLVCLCDGDGGEFWESWWGESLVEHSEKKRGWRLKAFTVQEGSHVETGGRKEENKSESVRSSWSFGKSGSLDIWLALK